MRVVTIIPHVGNEASGPSYSVVRLAQSLARAGEDVLLLSVRDGQLPASERFEHRVYPKAGFPASLWRSPALARALREEAPHADVLHAHGMWVMPAVYPGREARRARRPYVLSPRGSLSPVALAVSAGRKRLFWPLAHRRSFLAADCLHATSEQEYRDIRAFGLSNPVAVIPNGIDVPGQRRSAEGTRADAAARTLLYLGRIHPIKGLDLLLRAWQRVADGPGREWELRIVGPDEGAHRAELAQRVREQAIPRVVFAEAAYGEAKQAEYERAELYVLPTTTENFGMTIAEALASGTPVLTTTRAPWPELEPRGCGFWVERDDATFERALARALSLPAAELAAMGARGRRWMQEAFSWDALAGQMADVYRWLTGARGAGAEAPAPVRLS